MKNMKKWFAIFFTMMICISLSVPALAAGTCNDAHVFIISVGYCNGDYVNVRTGPGTNYSSVGYAYKNDCYTYYQTRREPEDGSWLHVHGYSSKYEDHIGWMYSQYYTPTEAARSLGLVYERA